MVTVGGGGRMCGWSVRAGCVAGRRRVGGSGGVRAAVGMRVEGREGEVLIEVKGVKKRFGKNQVLDGIDMVVRRGEAVGVIGPSGTGKSTVLRILSGLMAPDEGEVVVRGKVRQGLVSDDPNPQLRIGMVFQNAALFDSLSVGENVGFMLYENSRMSDEGIDAVVRESLRCVGLDASVAAQFPSELSGGQRKRVAFARAIIADPSAQGDTEEVVMYDEPTAGLDPIASTVIEDQMRDLYRSTNISSYVVVTHQHSTIRRACDRLVFLNGGRVVWEGTSEEFETTDNPMVRQFCRGEIDGPIQNYA